MKTLLLKEKQPDKLKRNFRNIKINTRKILYWFLRHQISVTASKRVSYTFLIISKKILKNLLDINIGNIVKMGYSVI